MPAFETIVRLVTTHPRSASILLSSVLIVYWSWSVHCNNLQSFKPTSVGKSYKNYYFLVRNLFLAHCKKYKHFASIFMCDIILQVLRYHTIYSSVFDVQKTY